MTISQIVGKTPIKITGSIGDCGIKMEFSDGSSCLFYHDQDCCESVDINDITGDWSDLLGHPLLVAEDRSGTSDPGPLSEFTESYTWTFYTFGGIGGYVDVRWYGESNGYYSESVDFKFYPLVVKSYDPNQNGDTDEDE